MGVEVSPRIFKACAACPFQFFPSCLAGAAVRAKPAHADAFQFFPSCLASMSWKRRRAGKRLSILSQLPPYTSRPHASEVLEPQLPLSILSQLSRQPSLRTTSWRAPLSILSQLPHSDLADALTLRLARNFQFFPSCLGSRLWRCPAAPARALSILSQLPQKRG
jgi:hypothetical protein